MKNCLFLAISLLLTLASCVNDTQNNAGKDASKERPLSLISAENPDLQYENLRLYPVIASQSMIQENSRLNSLKTLAEGMALPGFRILEQKQFGRGDQAWYHGLTVQNKTQDTILLLSGDIVKGGNQDRVLAHHEVILPMTVRNIEVFCVEAGRSSYYDPKASPAEKEAAAFKGFYSVASPKVRNAVQNSKDQETVWNAVAEVTKANHAESATKAYTALEQESAEKQHRDAYLKHLGNPFEQSDEVVGVVAVCGDRILSIDIFGNPSLFKRAYPGLLHGYVAEAASATVSSTLNFDQIQLAFENVAKLAAPHGKSTQDAGKFSFEGALVHLFGK